MKRIAIILALLIVSVTGYLLFKAIPDPPAAIGNQKEVTPVPRQEADADKRTRTDAYNAAASKRLRFDQSKTKLANNPLDRSTLSEDALIVDSPQASDLQVQQSLHALLTSIKILGSEKSYPSGLNVEITNALLGDNSRKVGYIPIDTPRINENGELIDQFGTPFWFHTLSSQNLSIISAGPDKEIMTADDIIYPEKP